MRIHVYRYVYLLLYESTTSPGENGLDNYIYIAEIWIIDQVGACVSQGVAKLFMIIPLYYIPYKS